MSNPSAAMCVIGDEILSGRTRDINAHVLAKALHEIGIDLREIRVVSDDMDEIIAAVSALSSRYDYVFTSGGIGPTHDDITADAVAAAFKTPIGVRADADAILTAYYAERGQDYTAARKRMARIPDGASLVENPISAAPGFRIENVFVFAGVPSIFEQMLLGVLPTLEGGEPLQTESINVLVGEGDLAAVLTPFVEAHPELKVGSYPFQREGQLGTNIVIRSADAEALKTARAELERALEAIA